MRAVVHDRFGPPEVLRIKEYGQDYFLQVTDARPDTGVNEQIIADAD